VSTLAMLVAGFVAGGALWWALQAPLGTPMLLRENYRGEAIPTAAGIVSVLAFLAVTAVAAVLESLGWVEDALAAESRRLLVPAVIGFALLGLFDDLAGSGHHRGFGGHATELARGRLTTGMLKLLGGAVVAVIAVSALPRASHTGWLLFDAALVALAANLANLLDRAPGRTTKVALVGFALLAAGTTEWPALAGPALLLGAALALLLPELAERAMVGDTGANALGAALGMGVVLTCSARWRIAVFVVLLAANLASEKVSFGAVIDSVRPLRWLDRWGNRRP
jgi:UDP-N-acetylmuramyl pentapeptide phosphotransferase/UDP-N-acetylglucosamine-1-phosphate transferase